MQSRTGSLGVGFAYIAMAAAFFLYGCIDSDDLLVISVAIPLAMLLGATSGTLLFGIHAHSPSFLLPFLMLQLIFLALFVGTFIYSLFYFLDDIQNHHESLASSVGMVVGMGAGAGVSVWWFLTVLSHFKEMRAESVEASVARHSALGPGISRGSERRRLAREFGLPPPPPPYSPTPVCLDPEALTMHRMSHRSESVSSVVGEAPPVYSEVDESASSTGPGALDPPVPKISSPTLSRRSSQSSRTSESDTPSLDERSLVDVNLQSDSDQFADVDSPSS